MIVKEEQVQGYRTVKVSLEKQRVNAGGSNQNQSTDRKDYRRSGRGRNREY